jgi:hypothetical protein
LHDYRLPEFRKAAAEQQHKEEEGTPVFNVTKCMENGSKKLNHFSKIEIKVLLYKTM